MADKEPEYPEILTSEQARACAESYLLRIKKTEPQVRPTPPVCDDCLREVPTTDQNSRCPECAFQHDAVVLAKDVKGAFSIADAEIRAAIGNTNAKCLLDRAEAVLRERL
jgi:hypothetical protein